MRYNRRRGKKEMVGCIPNRVESHNMVDSAAKPDCVADRKKGFPVLEQIVEQALSVLIPLCELMGIFIIAASSVMAFSRYLGGLIARKPCDVKFQLANGLALSLEFKMAAEILKTVLVRELEELLVLGAVIVLRALLSFLIHLEMKQIEHSKP